jgi:NADPH-dependent 2,4-dienoyl-CoA reductase/sulfur reductase-like enzyme
MTESIDVAIVGAGPAGMAAALQLQALGLRVRVLDEQASPGGQIYRSAREAPAARSALLGADYEAGRAVVSAFLASGIDYVPQASVWLVTAEREVHYRAAGQLRRLAAASVLFCCGAYERPMAIPGWTLPGVMTAGAAQIQLKSAGQVPTEPVILAGSGPLLYLLAWQYLRAGVAIGALVDTAHPRDALRALRHLPKALGNARQLCKGIGLLRAIRRAKVPWFRGASDLRVQGHTQAEGLSFVSAGQARQVPARLILLHQGVVPNTQPTLALQARHRWDDPRQCWVAEQDAWGELSVPGCFVAGDGAGIEGATAAALQGRIVAMGIAQGLQRIAPGEATRLAKPWRRRLARERSARPFLDALYLPQAAYLAPADETIVCRCEEVTAGAIRHYATLGCQGPNQAKAYGRCGMGPCQGRQCGLAVTRLLADACGVSPAEVGYYRIRPPLTPITLAELASEQ